MLPAIHRGTHCCSKLVRSLKRGASSSVRHQRSAGRIAKEVSVSIQLVNINLFYSIILKG
jgi:hypothetical protein